MAKEIIIPQGTYTVGIDFPEGTYIFDSMETDGTFDHFIKKVKGEDNKYYNLDGDVGYQIRITLKNEVSWARPGSSSESMWSFTAVIRLEEGRYFSLPPS